MILVRGERADEDSPIRYSLTLLWNLNFRAMPTALLWATALFVSIQAKSILIRLVAIALCGVASILGAHLIRRSLTPRAKISLASALSDRILVAALVISGLIFAITLENVSRYSHSHQIVRLLMVSNFITALIGWFFVQIVVVPIRLTNGSDLSASDTFRRSLRYVAENKKSLAISLLSLILGWPLFFFYLFLALTFAQAMTLSAFRTAERPQIAK